MRGRRRSTSGKTWCGRWRALMLLEPPCSVVLVHDLGCRRAAAVMLLWCCWWCCRARAAAAAVLLPCCCRGGGGGGGGGAVAAAVAGALVPTAAANAAAAGGAAAAVAGALVPTAGANAAVGGALVPTASDLQVRLEGFRPWAGEDPGGWASRQPEQGQAKVALPGALSSILVSGGVAICNSIALSHPAPLPVQVVPGTMGIMLEGSHGSGGLVGAGGEEDVGPSSGSDSELDDKETENNLTTVHFRARGARGVWHKEVPGGCKPLAGERLSSERVVAAVGP